MKRNLSIIVLFAAAALSSCGGNGRKTATGKPAATPRVSVESATFEEVSTVSAFTGTVEAWAVNNILPSAPRRIQKILFDIGDNVKAGQTVVELDNSSLRQAKVQLDNNAAEWERIDKLYKAGGVSQSDWESAKMGYEVAQSSYSNLKENTTLTTPITGVVTARNYENGDMYASTPILVIQQIKPVKLLIGVSESLYSKLSEGMKTEAEFDAISGRTFEGKISKIYPTIDPKTHTFQVEVRIENNDAAVRPGMYGRVKIEYDKRKRVVISDRAVVKQLGSGDRFVYVYHDDNTVEYRRINPGQRMNDRYEVLSGVESGEKLVVKGQNALNDGITVELFEK